MVDVPDENYSEVADGQLDSLESGSDAQLYNAVLDACELILGHPGTAQSISSAVRTENGEIVFRLPVAGYPDYKVFWSSAGPRIEAVFPHPD